MLQVFLFGKHGYYDIKPSPNIFDLAALFCYLDRHITHVYTAILRLDNEGENYEGRSFK